jgi:D-alanine-D-alanine ligase
MPTMKPSKPQDDCQLLEVQRQVDKIRILVLFGGRSGEHEVSLMSAQSVIAALDLQRYEPILVGIDHDGNWMWNEAAPTALEALSAGSTIALMRVVMLPSPDAGRLFAIRETAEGQVMEQFAQADVVFPVLHGSFGEDGCLQGFFELADLPYVGAGVLGSALGMDKGVFKSVMKAEGIPVVETLMVLRRELEDRLENVLALAESMARYPLFVKPANLGSSVGITKCHTRADLVEGLMEAARYDRRIIVERGIQAREIEVSVLGNDQPVVSVPGEVIPSRDFYSYEAKYMDGTSGLVIPADLSEGKIRQIQDYAARAYRAIDCAGMARVDFLVDKTDGAVYLNEVNTIPGFTQISMYSKLWEASGMSYSALVDRLIELALDRKKDRDRMERWYKSGG